MRGIINEDVVFLHLNYDNESEGETPFVWSFRVRKEEEQRLAQEALLKRQEEEKKLAEERKVKEAEEAQRAEEERERLEVEEALKQAELQKEREEAEAKALEEAERVRQERDRVMQQNQQERMERKKVIIAHYQQYGRKSNDIRKNDLWFQRIDEIMKRTRKGDGNDFKVRNWWYFYQWCLTK